MMNRNIYNYYCYTPEHDSFAAERRKPGEYSMKFIFDEYIENNITDEQVNRILEPVLKMILEGRFDRPARHRVFWSWRC